MTGCARDAFQIMLVGARLHRHRVSGMSILQRQMGKREKKLEANIERRTKEEDGRADWPRSADSSARMGGAMERFMDRTWDVSPSGQLGRGVAATPYRFDRPYSAPSSERR